MERFAKLSAIPDDNQRFDIDFNFFSESISTHEVHSEKEIEKIFPESSHSSDVNDILELDNSVFVNSVIDDKNEAISSLVTYLKTPYPPPPANLGRRKAGAGCPAIHDIDFKNLTQKQKQVCERQWEKNIGAYLAAKTVEEQAILSKKVWDDILKRLRNQKAVEKARKNSDRDHQDIVNTMKSIVQKVRQSEACPLKDQIMHDLYEIERLKKKSFESMLDKVNKSGQHSKRGRAVGTKNAQRYKKTLIESDSSDY